MLATVLSSLVFQSGSGGLTGLNQGSSTDGQERGGGSNAGFLAVVSKDTEYSVKFEGLNHTEDVAALGLEVVGEELGALGNVHGGHLRSTRVDGGRGGGGGSSQDGGEDGEAHFGGWGWLVRLGGLKGIGKDCWIEALELLMVMEVLVDNLSRVRIVQALYTCSRGMKACHLPVVYFAVLAAIELVVRALGF